MPAAANPPAPDLLSRIPLSARVVLDVGCGRGELGAAYKRQNPRARILGVTRDADEARIAAQNLDEVAVLDPETDDLPFATPGGIDCIIYSAALPHMRDPWAVIRRHAESLSPTGVMLICVPNIDHWSFADRLLRGTWHYESAGLFDQGHLRWFSLDNTGRGLKDAGLVPYDVHAREFDPEPARRFVAALAPALTTLGIDLADYARRAAALQHIWRVGRDEVQRITLAGNMLNPVGGVSHVRVVFPFQALATDPAVTATVTGDITLTAPADGSPGVFILHRPNLAGQQGLDLLRKLIRGGWLVVTEFDDHPDFFQGMQSPEQLSFRGVHAIQTSTPTLAEALRSRNPEIAIFPNAIVSLPDTRNFADPETITVFFGALNREQDWRDYMPVLNTVAALAGARLRFRVVHDEAFFNALETPHKTFTPTCDYDTYNMLLGGCEVSFMPLLDNPFNRAKSDLKFIEAAAHRVVPLASPVVYGDSIVDEQTGLLFRDPEHLRLLLMRLLVLPGWGRRIADQARDYVARERMLAYQVAPRLAWYRSLWARREELTAALLARISASA